MATILGSTQPGLKRTHPQFIHRRSGFPLNSLRDVIKRVLCSDRVDGRCSYTASICVFVYTRSCSTDAELGLSLIDLGRK